MTRPTGGAAAGFPAPGSSVPGAPPALKRALTPADGVAESATPANAEMSRDVPDRDAVVSAASGPAWPPMTAAVAMFGIAAGLELAGLLTRIGAGRRGLTPR